MVRFVRCDRNRPMVHRDELHVMSKRMDRLHRTRRRSASPAKQIGYLQRRAQAASSDLANGCEKPHRSHTLT
jgi:hypothetical protein